MKFYELTDAVRSGDIIRADRARRYVVPSAPGKRNKNDEKVTDLLYACYDAASTGAPYGKIFSRIKERYNQIIEGLELNLNLDFEFDRIEKNFIAAAGRDYAASRGEYLNGIIMSHYLGYDFIDAADVIFFDENGTFLSEKTNAELAERLSHSERAVIPASTGQSRTEASTPFPGAAPILPAPSWPAPSTRICMKTGPTSPVSWSRIPAW